MLPLPPKWQHPAQQGLVQAFSVYVDTLLVCSGHRFHDPDHRRIPRDRC